MLMKYRMVPQALKKMNTTGIRRSLTSTDLMDLRISDFEYALAEKVEADRDHFESEKGLDLSEDFADSCLFFCEIKVI